MSKKYIPIPEEFLDLDDNPWSAGPEKPVMTLAQILAHTIRFTPVGTFGDAERGLTIINAIKESDSHVTLNEDDYDWLIKHMKATAHKVWLAPDSAYLIHYIEKHVQDELGSGRDE